MQDVIQKCLEDQDPAVKLHGCKVRGDTSGSGSMEKCTVLKADLSKLSICCHFSYI